jgi:L-ascorbate metabolism protein UlaG (beta-lactamase superfamily)
VAGIGSKSVFPSKSQLREMDWMDECLFNINGREYKVTFVPVCHWSRRSAFDYNTRLWGGFVIETPFKQKIFYSGDTAYAEVFKEIGDKFGPFDLAVLPIGAYEPRELLSAQHVNP